MRVWIRSFAFVAGLLAYTGSSVAGTLDIRFALDQGSASFGASPITSTTTTLDGSARIVLTGVDAAGMITGSDATATLGDLSLGFMFRFDLAGPSGIAASITGPVQLRQEGTASSFFTGTAFALPGSNLRVQAMTDFKCVGPMCPSPPLMPAMFLLTNSDFAMIQLSSLGAPGSAQLRLGTLLFVPASVQSRLDVLGREVSRSFTAPEPSALGMLSLGTISLALAAVRGRGTRARAK